MKISQHSSARSTEKKIETEKASFADRLNTLGDLPKVELIGDTSDENICIDEQGTKKIKTATFIEQLEHKTKLLEGEPELQSGYARRRKFKIAQLEKK